MQGDYMEISINKELYYFHKSIPLKDDIGPLTDFYGIM